MRGLGIGGLVIIGVRGAGDSDNDPLNWRVICF